MWNDVGTLYHKLIVKVTWAVLVWAGVGTNLSVESCVVKSGTYLWKGEGKHRLRTVIVFYMALHVVEHPKCFVTGSFDILNIFFQYKYQLYSNNYLPFFLSQFCFVILKTGWSLQNFSNHMFFYRHSQFYFIICYLFFFIIPDVALTLMIHCTTKENLR